MKILDTISNVWFRRAKGYVLHGETIPFTAQKGTFCTVKPVRLFY